MTGGNSGLKRAVDRFLAGPMPGPASGVTSAAARFLAAAHAPEVSPSSADIDRVLVAALNVLTLAVERQAPRGGMGTPTPTPARTRRQALRAMEARHDREYQRVADEMYRRLEALPPGDSEARVCAMQDRQDRAADLARRHAEELRELRRRYRGEGRGEQPEWGKPMDGRKP